MVRHQRLVKSYFAVLRSLGLVAFLVYGLGILVGQLMPPPWQHEGGLFVFLAIGLAVYIMCRQFAQTVLGWYVRPGPSDEEPSLNAPAVADPRPGRPLLSGGFISFTVQLAFLVGIVWYLDWIGFDDWSMDLMQQLAAALPVDLLLDQLGLDYLSAAMGPTKAP
ncbi:MAG: hypothetical protein ACR2PO_01890 [Methyloligellaceae bacterium]